MKEKPQQLDARKKEAKSMSESEKANVSAAQVLGKVLAFKQRQMVEQCEILAEQVKHLHPLRAVDRQLSEAINEATHALLNVAARTTQLHQSQQREDNFSEDELPF